MQQFRRHGQIDLGAVEIGVAEPGGEHRQQPLDIGALPVPGLQPVNGRGMAQGVKARSSPSVVGSSDSGGLEQLGERAVDGASGQGRAVPVGEEGRGPTLGQRALCALGAISPQRIGELRGDRNEAGLVELGVAYGQQRIGQADILKGLALRLSQPQPCAVEQQEQRPQGVVVELDRTLPTDIYGTEQPLQLVTGVYVRRRRPRSSWLIFACRQRRAGRVAAADRVAVEAGQGAVLDGPAPGERSFAGKEAENVRFGDGVAADVPADMLAELMQEARAGVELRAMGPAPGDIVVNRIAETHARPSRSMSATSRRVPSCTLAYTAVDEMLRWPR